MGTEARLSYLLTAVAGGFAMTVVRNETQRHSAALKNAGQNPIGLLPLDKTIVFHFYDFVLVLSAVSSRCQLYSVGPSEGKLIPNSVFFIQSFREFRA